MIDDGLLDWLELANVHWISVFGPFGHDLDGWDGCREGCLGLCRSWLQGCLGKVMAMMTQCYL
jgi:hypothetical protein